VHYVGHYKISNYIWILAIADPYISCTELYANCMLTQMGREWGCKKNYKIFLNPTLQDFINVNVASSYFVFVHSSNRILQSACGVVQIQFIHSFVLFPQV
jgi:hypothetical protein